MKDKYKVVKRRSRMSAMINGNSKYALQYKDGHTVYADENTMGVLVFNTFKAAGDFVNGWSSEKDLIILRVKPLGRGKSITWVAEDVTTTAMDRFYADKYEFVGDAPDNTMAYPGVYVIEHMAWW